MEDGFYTSPEWRAVRDFVRERDANRCTVARLLGGRCGGQLHVHHIEPVEERPDLALDPDNCISSCATHHPQLEAIRRAIRVKRGIDLPRCPHRHPTREGREECDRRRRRRLEQRRIERLVAA